MKKITVLSPFRNLLRLPQTFSLYKTLKFLTPMRVQRAINALGSIFQLLSTILTHCDAAALQINRAASTFLCDTFNQSLCSLYVYPCTFLLSNNLLLLLLSLGASCLEASSYPLNLKLKYSLCETPTKCICVGQDFCPKLR